MLQDGRENAGEEGNGALISDDGHGGKDHAPTKGADKSHCGKAVHDGFDAEGSPVAIETILKGTEDGHGSDTEEEGGGDESIAEACGFALFGGFEFFCGVLAKFVEAFLNVKEFADQIADHEGEDDDAKLAEDGQEGAVEACPGEMQADEDDEDGEEEFDGELALNG